MNVIPQQSRIVVEPIPNDSKIIIPDMELKDDDGNKIEQPKRWRVVYVGTGRMLDSGVVVPMRIKVGDEVQFDFRFALRFYPPFVGGRHLIVVDYAGVYAVIERDNPIDGVGMPPQNGKILVAGVGPRPGTPIHA